MNEKIHRILEAAIQAPSGDNCQPWHLRHYDNLIDLYNVPERDQSLYNYKQRASFVAHGALLENLTLAAANEGLATSIKLFPDDKNSNLVAQVNLNESERRQSPLLSALFDRCTNRGPFRDTELSTAQIQSLCTCTNGFPISKVLLLRSNKEKTRLAAIACRNDWLVFINQSLHAFLFNQIRWSQHEADQSRDGLDIETLGLNKMDRFFFPKLRRWSLVNLMNKFGLAHMIGFKAARRCRESAAVGVVTILGKSPENYVQGGRVMQRLWLEATVLGLQFQPYAGIAFLMQSILEGNEEKLTPGSRKVLRQINAIVHDHLDLDGELPLLFFRLGSGHAPKGKSIRRSLDHVMLR